MIDDSKVVLFEQKDMKISAFIFGEALTILVDTYATLKGFHGDEDYYQHEILIRKEYFDKILQIIKNETKATTFLECIKEKFDSDRADLDIIDFCKKNNISFSYYNNISGGVDSNNLEKMQKTILSLQTQVDEARKNQYKRPWKN